MIYAATSLALYWISKKAHGAQILSGLNLHRSYACCHILLCEITVNIIILKLWEKQIKTIIRSKHREPFQKFLQREKGTGAERKNIGQ